MGGCPSFQTVKQLQALLFLPQKNLHPAFKKFPLQFTCAPSTRSEWRERERERERERGTVKAPCPTTQQNNLAMASG